MENDPKSRSTLGRVPVAKKAMRIGELSDKIGIAIKQYESAQKKFEAGADSYHEWQNIVKLLNMQIDDVKHFLAVAHHNLGVIHAGRHEFKKAEELFLKAVEIDPGYAIAYYNLAVVYKNLGDPIKAVQYRDKAKELGYSRDAKSCPE